MECSLRLQRETEGGRCSPFLVYFQPYQNALRGRQNSRVARMPRTLQFMHCLQSVRNSIPVGCSIHKLNEPQSKTGNFAHLNFGISHSRVIGCPWENGNLEFPSHVDSKSHAILPVSLLCVTHLATTARCYCATTSQCC